METPENSAGASQPRGYTAEQLQAIETLDRAWGQQYDIWTREGRYLASRVDGSGHALTADTPEELDAIIRRIDGNDS